MLQGSERAKRLATRRKAKSALAALRQLTRALTEWDRLEEADAIGFVQILPGDVEADYAADVLDLVGHAVAEAGQSRAIEVFVISTADNHRLAESHRRQTCQPEQDSTPTSAPRTVRAVLSSSEKPPITRRG